MAGRPPLVLDSTGKEQQLQAADNLKLPGLTPTTPLALDASNNVVNDDYQRMMSRISLGI